MHNSISYSYFYTISASDEYIDFVPWIRYGQHSNIWETHLFTSQAFIEYVWCIRWQARETKVSDMLYLSSTSAYWSVRTMHGQFEYSVIHIVLINNDGSTKDIMWHGLHSGSSGR